MMIPMRSHAYQGKDWNPLVVTPMPVASVIIDPPCGCVEGEDAAAASDLVSSAAGGV
jgi:hypothetical protein